MQTGKGQSIEDASMRIIEDEVGDHPYGKMEWPIVRRIIHSTADFDFAGKNAVVFGDGAASCGIDALARGCNIVTDVNGVGGLFNKQNLRDFKNTLICRISDEETVMLAKKEGMTRAEASMMRSKSEMDGGIIVIGNAPTALLEVIRMVGKGVRPALIIGMPVGFISAAESKARLETVEVPFITNRGRKGGSPSAAAIVNALFKLLRESPA